MNPRRIALLASLLALLPTLHAAPPDRLELRPGDHLAIVGSGLADRMQHDGWLETLIQAAYPKDQIVIRNLGFAGDEVALRRRSDGVPDTDEFLRLSKADVELAFYGFNESFNGYDGIEKFKDELEKWIKKTRAQDYSGKGAPRLVLFSPIAAEKTNDPNLPDPAPINTNLQNYTAAMAEVARANDVQFVDLFTASQQLYENAKQPLTFNGIHLTEAGNKALAPVIFKALFAKDAPAVTPATEKLRAAILEKNTMWESRYRTVDQYNIYGARSKIGYESGKGGPKITNADVLHPEMAVRDVMTANRDQRVWAVAQGGDLKIDDRNVPEVPRIQSNKPGPNPDATWPYLDAEEAIKKMTVPKGVKVELVASEAQFPEMVKPVQMAFDAKGRLWVSVWPNYPERTPWSKDGDKLLILDLNAAGKAVKCSTFLGDLNCPTGFQFYKDGVLVMRSPSLLWVRDTDGDGKGDWQERVLTGLDAADSHHETNSMVREPGGAVYCSDGVFHRTQVETAQGVVRNNDGAIYRFEPRTGRFERYAAYAFPNPHGRVFDYWGNDIITDGTSNVNYFAPALSGHIDYPGKHPTMKPFWDRPSRPCSGTAYLSSSAWPAEFNGNFLNCNVIGIQGIFRVKVTEDGSGLKGETLEHLITSTDPNFRPSGVTVGPDGAVYFMDWHNTIIGHLQHHLRDPNRDQQHGRIYRLTYEGMPLLKPAKIAGEPIGKLLDLLKEPDNQVRERARIEIEGRDTAQVIAATDQWIAGLPASDPALQHHLLEALWVKQTHNVVDVPFLQRMLQSPDPRARAQAVRVLGYWRDRVPEAVALVKVAANDDAPRVRLEAVRVASFFNGKDTKDAFLAACEALKKPTDYYLDYCFKETARQLQSLLKETVIPTEPKALAYVLDQMSDADLAKAPPVEVVLVARLERKGTSPDLRTAAVDELAKLRHTDRASEIAAALRRLDTPGGNGAGAVPELVKLVAVMPAADLAKARADFSTLAGKATQAGVRRAAWAALIAADANPATTWAAAKTPEARQALIDAIGAVSDPALRGKFQPLLVAALNDESTTGLARAVALCALPLMGADHAKASFALLATHLAQGVERTAAARAVMQLPRASWDKATAAPVTESILAYARTVPVGDRTRQDFVETVQAGMEFASLLPADTAPRIRKELRALGVSVFVVKTVREEMRYDTPRLVVEAGKPFEVIFENVDAMAHNIVFVAPGSRQSVAEGAQTMKPDQLDKQGRAYVPAKEERIFAASKMIEPGQKETLKIKAPAQEGDYEYVCTFPGHWSIMWGQLIVTKDVDAYLAAHPQAATAALAEPAAAHAHH